jgi:hypothetical protein
MASDRHPREAHEVAAMYIMAHQTPGVSSDCYLERAWSIAHNSASEAELIRLYAVWREMIALYESPTLDEASSEKIHDVYRDLEAKMAAIPAKSAQGLAIKMDLGRYDERGILAEALAAELAIWTGYDTRPETHP